MPDNRQMKQGPFGGYGQSLASLQQLVLVVMIGVSLWGCSRIVDHPVAELYIPTSPIDTSISPVVVTTGFLGSVLVDRESGEAVWGRFLGGQQAVFRDEVQRRLALPMTGADSLAEMRDAVEPVGSMGNAVVELPGKDMVVNAYPGLVRGLLIGASTGTGGQQPTEADLKAWARSFDEGVVDKEPVRGVAFDWRRDISESTNRLDKVVRRAYQENLDKGLSPQEARVDIVSHSLGGLLIRYYLRYGTQPLPADGTLPVLDWGGAAMVGRAIFVGPPNNGSLDALFLLANGGRPHQFMLKTPATVAATFVSLYQLLPRNDALVVRSSVDDSAIDIYDAENWDRMDWGLMGRDRQSTAVLETLLPEIHSESERRAVAKKYLQLCLKTAQQFHRTLDIPAHPPEGTTLHLFASNTVDTESLVRVDPTSGEFVEVVMQPGDGRVTRFSALGEMRTSPVLATPLESPIQWSTVHFVPGEHFGLVDNPVFINNLLYLLLQAP